MMVMAAAVVRGITAEDTGGHRIGTGQRTSNILTRTLPEYSRVDRIETADGREQPEIGLREAVPHQESAAPQPCLQLIQGAEQPPLRSSITQRHLRKPELG